MAVKLIKACKDLNVGMKTVSDFCALMGYPIPSDPNYRIEDDLYLLLQKEFGFDRKPNHRGIQSIGVENFRKFEKLEPVSLDGVTYIRINRCGHLKHKGQITITSGDEYWKKTYGIDYTEN